MLSIVQFQISLASLTLVVLAILPANASEGEFFSNCLCIETMDPEGEILSLAEDLGLVIEGLDEALEGAKRHRTAKINDAIDKLQSLLS